jgi:hypothetical protein
MTLEKYLKHLNKIVEKNPEALKYEVIYAKDDEGNEFNAISYKPSLGFLDVEDNEFTSVEDEDFKQLDEEPNVICIN